MASALDNGFVIATITGTGGDGKSYSVVQELVEQRLVKKNCDLVTNLPLRLDEFCQYAADQNFGDPEEIRKRIHLIPEETLKQWRQGDGGPWDLTFDRPTDLYIDEAHVFCQKGNKEWEDFLGEARHENCQRIVFLTQSVEKLAKAIGMHAKVRMRIEKGDVHRTKWFAIPMAHVYELLASVTGSYAPYIYRVEEVKDAREKWQSQYSDGFKFKQRIFDLYDSYSQAGGSSEAGDTQHEPQEFELRPRVLPGKRDYRRNGRPVWTAPTWLWFLGTHYEPAVKILAVLGVFYYLTLGGGSGHILNGWNATVQEAVGQNFNRKTPTYAKTPHDAQSVGDGASGTSDCGCKQKARLNSDLTAALERERQASRRLGALVALNPRWIKFAGGDLVYLNNMIHGGPYDGQNLEEIDFAGRRVRIDDEWIRLQARQEVEPTENDAEVRKLLQRAAAEAERTREDRGATKSILVPSALTDAVGGGAQHPQ